MKKLLVVGDSICTRYLQVQRSHEVRPEYMNYIWQVPTYKYWFEYIAELLKVEIINKSYCGSGNQQIFDNTIYSLTNNEDIEYAIIGWSSFDRIDIPFEIEVTTSSGLIGEQKPQSDNLHLNLSTMMSSNEKYKHYIDNFRKDKFFNIFKMVDKFINYSKTVELLCQQKNIKLLQLFTVEPYQEGYEVKDLPNRNRVLKHLINKFDEIDSFWGYPGTGLLGGVCLYELYGMAEASKNKDWKEYVLCSDYVPNDERKHYIVDAHPNGKAHKLIFDTLKDSKHLKKWQSDLTNRKK